MDAMMQDNDEYKSKKKRKKRGKKGRKGQNAPATSLTPGAKKPMIPAKRPYA